MSPTSGLRVRQHQRWEVQLPVEFVVCEEHRVQVRFSATSSAAARYAVHGTSIDISPGGIGFSCRQFLPRMCEGLLRVFDPTPVGTKGDSAPVLEAAFEQRVRVRRVEMTGREPAYFIGVAFTDAEMVDAGIGHRISMLLKRPDDRADRRSQDSGGPDA